MPPLAADQNSHGTTADFIDTLSSFSRLHRAQRWEGTFGEFLSNILPGHAVALARTSHEYVWDMLRWHGRAAQPDASENVRARELFKRELFGIDEPLSRVVDYFKAAAAGSDVGRRLLLMLGPPSGGKSTLAILLKRGLEEYSRTDEGALYAIRGSPLRENPLNLIPTSLRAEFRDRYGVHIGGELSPWARDFVEREFEGDFVRVPVERVFLNEASRIGIGTYAPHDPTTADIAEFHKFLQEKENEALLDRMVIIKIPYALSYRDESRIYQKLVSGAPAFRNVHLDPHVLNLAAVFGILTRLGKSEREGLDPPKKLRLYAGEAVEGVPETEVIRLHAETPEEGMTGVSPRFVVNAISNAITRGNTHSLTSMELLLALKDSIESDARMDAKQKKAWIDHLVTARKEFYNRWVKEDVHRAMFASFEEEAQQLLEKYLDEVEASLDHRQVTDPITGETRPADERFLRSVEEKIKVSDSGKMSFRQEVVRKAMVAFKAGEKFKLASHARMREAIEQYLFEERRDVLPLVSSTARPADDARPKISVVQQRVVSEYGYDEHSAKEALSYVTTLLAQE